MKEINLDIFGRPIMPGDLVVYGIRSGNSGGMRYGVVLESKTQYDSNNIDDSRVLVLSYRQFTLKNEVSLARPSPQNMIVVPRETFPDNIQEKLFSGFNITKEK